MKYLSVCSGIEAATVAWHGLGWEPLAFSEIEAFPRKVLSHRYPDVPLHGDFTVLRDQKWIADADLLVGGTPCQAFSVAGLRQSLSDDRGNLTLEFVRLANAIDDFRRIGGKPASIIVWENVPGVLSVKDNAFGCFLGAIVGNDTPLVPTGGKWTNAGMVVGPKRTAAWRILDAQYFGVAQRRRRVFVVASARDGFDPEEVLFEREGLRRDTPPSRKSGQVTPTLTKEGTGVSRTGFNEEGWYVETPKIVGTLTATGVSDYGAPAVDAGHYLPIAFSSKDYGNDATSDLSPTLRAMPHNESHANGGGQMAVAQPTPFGVSESSNVGHCLRSGASKADKHESTTYIVQPIPINTQLGLRGNTSNTSREGIGIGGEGDPAFTLQSAHGHAVAQPIGGVDYENNAHSMSDPTGPLLKGSLTGGGHPLPALVFPMAVRRLTPRECERLQGFPDDYTAIPNGADGPRYKALGNSMAVPVMRWIGKRINKFIKGVDTV